SSAPPKPVAKGSVRTKPTGPFPLPEGHWYGPESNDDRNHSGLRTSEREGIRQIQRLLGLKADGGYGPVTKAGVVKWQKEHK
ncbi:peptidoglycan-binding domain-containing protein, partial [Staphylococcus aureus]